MTLQTTPQPATSVPRSTPTDWHPVLGKAGKLLPNLPWTPAIELRIRHSNWDRKSYHPAAPGAFINRHVQAERSLPIPLVTRDAVDILSDPENGVGLALESGKPDKKRLIGGILYDAENPQTRHQREWDFLAEHLKEALLHYRASLPLMNHNDWLIKRRGDWSEWEICAAIAHYAGNWKSRSHGLFHSPHPVDVLMHSYHCAGVANVSMALAMVAGIPARRVSTSGHSTVEFFIQGQWIWSDNIRQGVLIHTGSYQNYLSGFNRWVHHSKGQKEHHAKAEVLYRSPYDYSSSLWWRCGGELPANPAEGLHPQNGDAANGYGITVHYDPSTATALYPNEDEYLFHADQESEPWLSIGAKGSWLHAPLDISDNIHVSRSFYISESTDNPIEGAEIRVWCDENSQLSASFDGHALDAGKIVEQRHLHKATSFKVPKELLHAGSHKIVIHGAGNVFFFPDLVAPYAPCVSQANLSIAMESVQTDPVWMPPA